MAPESPACAAIRARAPADVTLPPFSAVGRLDIARASGFDHCTAVRVSHRLALTAAHCLNGVTTDALTFRHAPISANTRTTARVTRIVRPDNPSHPSHDWAILILSAPLEAAGTLPPLFSGKLRDAGAGEAILAGYAGLTPDTLTLARDCGRPLAVAGQLMATCSAMPGDSGAPLFWIDAQGARLLGITTSISGTRAPNTTGFAPWFRFRQTLAAEIAAGN
jgi:V8-like Glu-specific endopeptidase